MENRPFVLRPLIRPASFLTAQVTPPRLEKKETRCALPFAAGPFGDRLLTLLQGRPILGFLRSWISHFKFQQEKRNLKFRI